MFSKALNRICCVIIGHYERACSNQHCLDYFIAGQLLINRTKGMGGHHSFRAKHVSKYSNRNRNVQKYIRMNRLQALIV